MTLPSPGFALHGPRSAVGEAKTRVVAIDCQLSDTIADALRMARRFHISILHLGSELRISTLPRRNQPTRLRVDTQLESRAQLTTMIADLTVKPRARTRARQVASAQPRGNRATHFAVLVVSKPVSPSEKPRRLFR